MFEPLALALKPQRLCSAVRHLATIKFIKRTYDYWALALDIESVLHGPYHLAIYSQFEAPETSECL